jgi:hypothetical protein
METYLEHTRAPAVSSGVTAPLARPRSLRRIRVVLTATAVLVFVLMALFDERSQLLLVGLAPLALIAPEAVWHLWDDKNGDV